MSGIEFVFHEVKLDSAGILCNLNDPSVNGFNHTDLNNVHLPNGGPKPRVLINPRSSKAFSIKGRDIAAFEFHSITPHNPDPVFQWGNNFEVRYARERQDGKECDPPLPYYPKDLLEELSFKSPATAAEIVEVYGMSLLRDNLLGQYPAGNSNVQLVLAALNSFGDHFRGPKQNGKVTPKTLFRGNGEGSIRGGYRSQFLIQLRPPQFPSGCSPDTADLINAGIFFWDFAEPLTAPRPYEYREWGLTWDHYVRIQNGEIPDPYRPGDFWKPAEKITTGRLLGSLVHVDSFYQEWAFALDILAGGNYRRSPVSVYGDAAMPRHAKNEGDGPTYGIPDAAGLLGEAALLAGRAAWHGKYLVARRARPEVLAGLVHKLNHGGNTATYGPVNSSLYTGVGPVYDLLEAVASHNANLSPTSERNYLLSQVFPEASPAHPSWTSGHATVSGAYATVLKAIFDDLAPIRSQVDDSIIRDERGKALLVGRELDKPASNEAFGRNFAGVHFRSDGEHGIRLGEAVTIQLLQDHLRTYAEEIPPKKPGGSGPEPYFELTRRDGARIRIHPCGIETLTKEYTEERTSRAEDAVEPETHLHPML